MFYVFFQSRLSILDPMIPKLNVVLTACAALTISCVEPPPPTTINGIAFQDLQVGSRDLNRKAPISVVATNTGSADIPGLQVAFEASDADGKMGPFWLPPLGSESEWALKAGESRAVRAEIIGFGNRDMSSTRIVDAKILGANVTEVADRPEALRREVFSKLIYCERSASDEALAKYPEVAGQSNEEFMRAFELRRDLENELADQCKSSVVEELGLTVDEKRLISEEGARMSWPPMGNN